MVCRRVLRSLSSSLLLSPILGPSLVVSLCPVHPALLSDPCFLRENKSGIKVFLAPHQALEARYCL